MKTEEEKRETKLVNGKECWMIHVVDLGQKGKKLLIEDKQNARIDELECVQCIYNVDGTVHKRLITSATGSNFAVFFGKGDKTILFVDSLKIYCGYSDSSVKMLLIVAKKEQAIFFAYDSATMKTPAIIFTSNAKKSLNFRALFKGLENLGFCEGIPAVYKSEVQSFESKAEVKTDGEEKEK